MPIKKKKKKEKSPQDESVEIFRVLGVLHDELAPFLGVRRMHKERMKKLVGRVNDRLALLADFKTRKGAAFAESNPDDSAELDVAVESLTALKDGLEPLSAGLEDGSEEVGKIVPMPAAEEIEIPDDKKEAFANAKSYRKARRLTAEDWMAHQENQKIDAFTEKVLAVVASEVE